MNERSRSRRDFIQNITIAVLTVSAVLLFAQTQLVSLGEASPVYRFLAGPDTASSVVAAVQQDDTLPGVPVRVAAASPYGRYGSVVMTTDDEDYLPLGQLLTQALSAAQSPASAAGGAFLTALEQNGAYSVYYDFLSPLPLSILAELAQTEPLDESVQARRLLLTEENGSVTLYLWDGESRCYRCGTTLSSADLSGAVGQYELGNASFAFEDAMENAGRLAPVSLLPSETPLLPQLSSAAPDTDTSRWLSTLGFNPNTQNRYRESDTTEVITESDGRTLRLSPDGTVLYQGGNSTALSLQSSGDALTLAEAAGEAQELLNDLFATAAGDAQLYLEQVRQSGAVTVLRFGCHVNGVPIRPTDGGNAATVTLNGSAVTSLELRIRRYTITETDSPLLPLRQALAIAAEGGELSLGYADSGGDTVNAAWLAD